MNLDILATVIAGLAILIPFILQAIDETVTEKIYKKERYKARKSVRLQKEAEEKAKFLMELGLWI